MRACPLAGALDWPGAQAPRPPGSSGARKCLSRAGPSEAHVVGEPRGAAPGFPHHHLGAPPLQPPVSGVALPQAGPPRDRNPCDPQPALPFATLAGIGSLLSHRPLCSSQAWLEQLWYLGSGPPQGHLGSPRQLSFHIDPWDRPPAPLAKKFQGERAALLFAWTSSFEMQNGVGCV